LETFFFSVSSELTSFLARAYQANCSYDCRILAALLRVLKSRCVSGERGRGAALGVLVVDVDGVFDVEGLGLGVAADVDGGGGGRADISMLLVFRCSLSLIGLFLSLAAGDFGDEAMISISILSVCL
jgi:hypothetical protein